MAEDHLTEDERRALRGSKFAPLPAPPPHSFSKSRLAHPGGPVTTNKAAALAKFLERKLQDPEGLKSLNPDLLEAAVKNAKKTVQISGRASTSGRKVRHVDSFDDSVEDSSEDENEDALETKKNKRKRKKKKAFKENRDDRDKTEKKKKKKKSKEKTIKRQEKDGKKKKSKS